MESRDLNIEPWGDYELVDSGGNRKLERFGSFLIIRPETQALWKPRHPELWVGARAEFRSAEGKGAWKKDARAPALPPKWQLGWRDVRFNVRLTSFKHLGVFPEQAANWEWIIERVASMKKHFKERSSDAPEALSSPKVLNLFGYTGIASIAAAMAGAQVTHVDASKQSNEWSKENAALSGIPEGGIRYVLEDALKFVEREARRGNVYEGIILDPPAFGRGPKKEVWHIEESLPRLLDALKNILSPAPGSFFLLNGYAAGYGPQSFLQAVQDVFPEETGAVPKMIDPARSAAEFGELRIRQSGSERSVTSGIYVRFVR